MPHSNEEGMEMKKILEIQLKYGNAPEELREEWKRVWNSWNFRNETTILPDRISNYWLEKIAEREREVRDEYNQKIVSYMGKSEELDRILLALKQ